MMGRQAAFAGHSAPPTYDFLIVGGGPAGLATAIHAAQQGLRAVVVDDALPPYDKACGEAFSPAGVAALRALGIEASAAMGHPISGMRYIDGAISAEYLFAPNPGLGVRRTRLMAALWARAQALGVQCHPGTRLPAYAIEGDRVSASLGDVQISARVLVGADGLHSRIRRQARLQGSCTAERRYGLRVHASIMPWTSCIEVHLAAGLEAYVTPLGDTEVSIAFLGPQQSLLQVDQALQLFPELNARLAGHAITGAMRGAGPLQQPVRRRYAPCVALVGDAAGYLDAVTSEGMTLSFRCAQALVETVAAGKPLRHYERAYRRITRAYYHEARAYLWLCRRPWLRRLLLRLFARLPAALARWVVPRALRMSK